MNNQKNLILNEIKLINEKLSSLGFIKADIQICDEAIEAMTIANSRGNLILISIMASALMREFYWRGTPDLINKKVEFSRWINDRFNKD